MLAALMTILAAASGHSGTVPMPFGPNAGYWRFTSANLPITFSCRLVRNDSALSGSCMGGGFKSDGLAYGSIDGSEVHLSIYFERLNNSGISYDFAGLMDGDRVSGSMLTTDGDRAEFEARPGVMPPAEPEPLVQ